MKGAGKGALLVLSGGGGGKSDEDEETEKDDGAPEEDSGDFDEAFSDFWDAVQAKKKDVAAEALKRAMAACAEYLPMPGGPVDRATLMSRIRRRADIENDDGFVTDADLRDAIDSAMADLHDQLVKARGHEYYRSTDTITTVAGTKVYAVGEVFGFNGIDTFYQLLAVNESSSGRWRRCDPFDLSEMAELLNASAIDTDPWSDLSPYRYRLLGADAVLAADTAAHNRIEILPTPRSAFSVRVDYIPACSYTTTADYDEETDPDLYLYYNGVNGWEDYAVWRVVAEILAKEESDASYAEAKVAEMKDRIASLAGARDAGRPEKARLVRNAGRSTRGYR